jgi:hypothetical protein
MANNVKAANVKAEPQAEPQAELTDTFDPAALLTLISAELDASKPASSRGTGAAAVPVLPVGLPDHLSALQAAGLSPISGADGHVSRFGGPVKGTNPRGVPIRKRTAIGEASMALCRVLQAGPVPIGHVYRMALHLTGLKPEKPVQPQQLLEAISKQDGRSVTVSFDGTVQFSSHCRGNKGESRLIKV